MSVITDRIERVSIRVSEVLSSAASPLNQRQDAFVKLVNGWQEPTVAGVRRTVIFIDERLPRQLNLPGLPAITRPAPAQFVRTQFAIAERVLDANKRFALSLVNGEGRAPAAPADAPVAAPVAAEAPVAAAAAPKARRAAQPKAAKPRAARAPKAS